MKSDLLNFDFSYLRYIVCNSGNHGTQGKKCTDKLLFLDCGLKTQNMSFKGDTKYFIAILLHLYALCLPRYGRAAANIHI